MAEALRNSCMLHYFWFGCGLGNNKKHLSEMPQTDSKNKLKSPTIVYASADRGARFGASVLCHICARRPTEPNCHLLFRVSGRQTYGLQQLAQSEVNRLSKHQKKRRRNNTLAHRHIHKKKMCAPHRKRYSIWAQDVTHKEALLVFQGDCVIFFVLHFSWLQDDFMLEVFFLHVYKSGRIPRSTRRQRTI